MKTLRLLNILCLLLIFTPFFQMCSDKKAVHERAPMELPPQISAVNADSVAERRLENQGNRSPDKPKSFIARFWELITIPAENFTVTGFGLLILAGLNIIDGTIGDIWIGSVCAIISIVLTVTTLVLLYKNRLQKILAFQMANVITVLAMLACGFFSLESIIQIKWGIYLYLASHSLLLVTINNYLKRMGVIS